MIHLLGVPAVRIDPDTARGEAREILADRRFRSAPVPRPLRGLLEWLGDRLHDLAAFVADVLRPIPGPVWFALAVLALVIAGLVFARFTSRPGGPVAQGRPVGGAGVDGSEDPEALEAAAAEAERRGDLSTALRLRFRSGLLRLDERVSITFRPSLTTGEVRRLLGSGTFDELASVFEEVAYGGRDAELDDVAEAREAWPRLLREAQRR